MTMLPKPPRRPRKPARRIVRHTPVRKVSARHRATGEAQDQVWAEAVKKRAGYQCERCGLAEYQVRAANFHAHHVRCRRVAPSLRLDLRNGVGLCAICHSWAHRQRAAFKAWILAAHPETAALWRPDAAALVKEA